jgi:hypothetical protein
MRRLAVLGLALLAGPALAQPPGGSPPAPVPFPAGRPADPAGAMPANAQPLVMEDQWEQTRDLSPYRGDVVILLYGDRKGMAGSRSLGEKLHVEFHPAAAGLTPSQARKVAVKPLAGLPAGQRSPDVHVVPVACIGTGVPNVIKTMIRNQVKKGSPDVAVWMDYEDAMKKRFGLRDGTPNLVVFDALGRPRFKVAGEPDEQQYARLVQVVESLRAEAATAPPPVPVTISPPGTPPMPTLPPTAVPPAAAPPLTGPDLSPSLP